MKKVEYAIAALDKLADRYWLPSHDLLFGLGQAVNRHTSCRQVLKHLVRLGVIEVRGKGKQHWRLVRDDYSRINPLRTAPTEEHKEKLKMEEGLKVPKWDYSQPTKLPKSTWEDEVKTYTEEIDTQTPDLIRDLLRKVEGEVVQLRAKVEGLDTLVELQEERIKLQNEQIKELEKTRPPIEIIIKKPNKTKVKLDEHIHPIFEQVMFHIQCKDDVMIVGPRGCGKSLLSHQVAKAMERPFGMISLSGGVTEGKLFGRSVPEINTGKNIYHRSMFVELFEEGGVFLLDESDAGDPNVLVSLNSALANGVLAVDRAKNPMAQRHAEFVCIAAANTWGNGADRQYVGRNHQDSAFTERFVQLEMHYDKDLERALCPGATELVDKLHLYRDKVNANRLERTISTRFIVRAYHWMQAGKPIEYIEDRLFVGWRSDEITKVKGY